MCLAASKRCVLEVLFVTITDLHQAEELLAASMPDKEYLPITGLPEFTRAAAKLAYGADSIPFVQNSVGCSSIIFTATGAQEPSHLDFCYAIYFRDRCSSHRWCLSRAALSVLQDHLSTHAVLGQPFSGIS
jgi:hypothetical protein